MKRILIYCLQICVLLSSCDSRDNIRRQYELLASDTINLCINRMMAVSYNVDDILQVKKNCMSSCKKLVVYADTSLCFPCYVKQLPNWYNLTNSVKRDCGESVEFCFIINVQKQKLNEILEAFNQVGFDYPCFLDTSNVFRKANKNIPDNNLFHTLLLNDSNNVVMVGNPQTNIKIRELLFRYLKDDRRKGNMP